MSWKRWCGRRNGLTHDPGPAGGKRLTVDRARNHHCVHRIDFAAPRPRPAPMQPALVLPLARSSVPTSSGYTTVAPSGRERRPRRIDPGATRGDARQCGHASVGSKERHSTCIHHAPTNPRGANRLQSARDRPARAGALARGLDLHSRVRFSGPPGLDGAGLWRIRQYRIASTPLYPSPEPVKAAAALTGAGALVCVSADTAGPVMLGFLSPVVLLPESFLCWGRRRRPRSLPRVPACAAERLAGYPV